MPVCGNATAWAKVGLAFVLLGFGLHCAGFATQYWEQSETIQENTVISYGLWKGTNCSGGHNSACNSVSIPSSYTDAAYDATRALAVIVLVLMFITAVVFVFYVATDKFRELTVGIFITVMCFITATFGIVSMIIWLAQLPTDFYPGYSFGLCVFATLLVFLAGILMIPDIRKFNKNRRRNPEPIRVSPSERPRKYDSIARHEDRSYNRKFASPEPDTAVRHYYNPNRKPYVRSPPPSYGRISPQPIKKYRDPNYLRTDIQTPDVYLGRDAKVPIRRY